MEKPIHIIYNQKEKKIRIFGNEFVKNNKEIKIQLNKKKNKN